MKVIEFEIIYNPVFFRSGDVTIDKHLGLV